MERTLTGSLTLTYQGKDLVIASSELESLGVKPGDTLLIKPAPKLKKREFAPGEREELGRILGELSGSWTAEEVAQVNPVAAHMLEQIQEKLQGFASLGVRGA